MQGADDADPRDDGADRLEAQVERMRWVGLHCAGRALLRRVEVEDLVQEALLRAWQDRARWPAREPGEFGLARWLAALVRHAAIDAARASRARKRAGREQRLELGDFSRSGPSARELPAQTAGPATRAGAQETRLALERAFRSLCGEHRRVIALRQFEGRSARDVGLCMGKSEVAVHSLFRRALQAWEREVGGSFSFSSDESRSGMRLGPP